MEVDWSTSRAVAAAGHYSGVRVPPTAAAARRGRLGTLQTTKTKRPWPQPYYPGGTLIWRRAEIELCPAAAAAVGELSFTGTPCLPGPPPHESPLLPHESPLLLPPAQRSVSCQEHSLTVVTHGG